jgi:hypothetical protein
MYLSITKNSSTREYLRSKTFFTLFTQGDHFLGILDYECQQLSTKHVSLAVSMFRTYPKSQKRSKFKMDGSPRRVHRFLYLLEYL